MRDYLLIYLCTPFLMVSNIVLPLALKALQSELSPSKFYGCQITSTAFQLYEMSYTEGMSQALLKLYPYLILILLSGVIKGFVESQASYQCNSLSIKVTAGLLDILFNKILVLSETAKQTNAAGSLANLLFTDTFKIQFFIQKTYLVILILMELAIAIIYIATIVDVSALIGLACFLIAVPMLMYMVSALG